jgi:oligopeptide transport system substrate-binding protein
MRKIILILLLMLFLASCKAGEEETRPRTILEWQPTPFGERPPPPEVNLPQPEPAWERPDIPEAPKAMAVDMLAIPTMVPTPQPPNVYVSEANGFAVPFPNSWQLVESDGQSVQIYDPALDVVFSAFSSFKDDETSYQDTLDFFVGEEASFTGELSLVSEEESSFAGDGIATIAFLLGQNEEGDELSIWLAYAEALPHTYVFTAFGKPDDVEARQTTLKTILSQVQPGGAHIYGLERGETLVMLGGDPIPRFLDPARQTGSAAGYIGLLYSGLVRLTPELQVEPDLAESWTVSEDGTVYTFTLREDLKFHDGKPITASNFQESWERAADPETGSTTADTYLGDILGVKEKLNGEAVTISGLEVVDEGTLIVTLDEPKPYFLSKLTYPTSYVVDLDSVDPEDEAWVYEPNASGPYTLDEFREDEVMIFKRNENYYTSPATPQVVFLLYRIGSSISIFESGEVDIIGIGGNEAKRVRQPGDELHEQWLSTTSLCTTLVQMNNMMPPMDDPDVRRAFSLAVDKERYNELMNEGIPLVAESILPPAMPGYSAEKVQELAEIAYDPQAAQAALAESAYSDGLPPIILTAGGYGDADLGGLDALIANWNDVLGAEVTVEFVDPEDYTHAARENHGQMVSYGWCADYPDPQNFLDVLYHSDSEFNVAGYSNPEIDALLEASRTELDPANRLALYQEINMALLDDTAAIPLVHGVSDVLVNDRVKGYVLSPMGAPIIHRLSLEEPQGGE